MRRLNVLVRSATLADYTIYCQPLFYDFDVSCLMRKSMKQLFIILGIVSLYSLSISAMFNFDEYGKDAYSTYETWPSHFYHISCPGFDKLIDTSNLIASNPFWKKALRNTSQEQKNTYLKEALQLPGGDPLYHRKRKAIVCALAIGAYPDIYDHFDGTALYKALEHHDYSLAEFALKCGANPNYKIDIFFTREPVFFQARTPRMAELLIEHNANISLLNRDKQTVLHSISRNDLCSQNELVEYYVKRGCDINAQDYNGATPLMIAMNPWADNKILVNTMLKAGADTRIQNNEGKTVWGIIELKFGSRPKYKGEIKDMLHEAENRRGYGLCYWLYKLLLGKQ